MRASQKIKKEKWWRRRRRTRSRIFGTKERPRLSVYRSLKHIYAQIINDEEGETLVFASDLELKKSKNKTAPKGRGGGGKIAEAREVGKLIAKKALEKKISKVVFDRGGFQYHGRVRAVSEGAREGGLKF